MTAAPLPAGDSAVLDRADFPVCERWVYLNHAGVNALPLSVTGAMAAWATGAAEEGSDGYREQEHLDGLRLSAAGLMGVTPDEVAVVKNTTEGLAFVAGGLEWHEGDRVLVPDHEFPSNFYPWTALADRGVEVRTIRSRGTGETVPTEAVAEALSEASGSGPPPRLVALSWVQFRRGWRADLEAVARVVHEAGSLLCVDAIQGLGVLPAAFARADVDFATADAHKWLLGPPGVGVLYVRRELIERLRPLEPGWASVVHREEWDNLALLWDPSARRFEGGTANLPGVVGLRAAIDLLTAAGVERVWAHVDALCRHLADRLPAAGAELLTDRRPAGASGIVTFRLPGLDGTAVVEELRRRGIVAAPRGGGVRLAPHGYNTGAEMESCLAAVEEIAAST